MGGPDEKSRIFRTTPEEISAADAWIADIARAWGIADRTAFGARICVAEIAANVLEHGTSSNEPVEFGVTLRRHGSGLDIEITDSGKPFDLTAAPERPAAQTLESAQVGGLGLHLVRSYAADITYRHDGVRNRVTLHLPPSAPAP